ncbi:unnamed protein product [Cladocopium goreaui]|uniref:Uncharacterized protein n=1 Tax=Cladocopium goreaui TaxID=2562237 RepID=A0A9P1FXV4_9DINO|nr:unnamed protein product [Cladocopium goreaui]
MVVPAHAMSVWRCMVSGFLQRVSAPWSRPSSWRCRDCRHFSDAMDHSLLPRVRMPFSHVDAAVSSYFTGSQGPSLQKMAAHGGRSKSSLQKMRSALLGAGALCAEKIQRKRRLTGLLEADATSLRKMRLGKTRTLRYFQAFGVVKREKRHADARNFGKPPLENAQSNERAGLFDLLAPSWVSCATIGCYPFLEPKVCLDGEAPLPEPNLRLLPAGVLLTTQQLHVLVEDACHVLKYEEFRAVEAPESSALVTISSASGIWQLHVRCESERNELVHLLRRGPWAGVSCCAA